MIQSLSGSGEIRVVQMENEHVRLTLTSFGAAIFSVEIKNHQGKWEDIALTCDTIEDFIKNRNFYGATVGRVVNRIKNGTMTIDDSQYQLTKNEGNHCAHGGESCFAWRNWETDIRENSVVFHLLSRDGESGFPGNVNVEVTYAFDAGGEILITHRAETDKKTIFNMTNHIYWCLDGLGKNIYEQELFVKGRYYLESDEELIPSGQILSVKGTPFDFTSPHPIGEHIRDNDSSLVRNGGYDVSFVRDGRGMGLAARLVSASKKRILEVESTLPDVHIYTGNFLGGEKGKGDVIYRPHDAICIESERFPNAVNEVHFGDIFLLPEQPYFERIRFRITQK